MASNKCHFHRSCRAPSAAVSAHQADYCVDPWSQVSEGGTPHVSIEVARAHARLAQLMHSFKSTLIVLFDSIIDAIDLGCSRDAFLLGSSHGDATFSGSNCNATSGNTQHSNDVAASRWPFASEGDVLDSAINLIVAYCFQISASLCQERTSFREGEYAMPFVDVDCQASWPMAVSDVATQLIVENNLSSTSFVKKSSIAGKG